MPTYAPTRLTAVNDARRAARSLAANVGVVSNVLQQVHCVVLPTGRRGTLSCDVRSRKISGGASVAVLDSRHAECLEGCQLRDEIDGLIAIQSATQTLDQRRGLDAIDAPTLNNGSCRSSNARSR